MFEEMVAFSEKLENNKLFKEKETKINDIFVVKLNLENKNYNIKPIQDENKNKKYKELFNKYGKVVGLNNNALGASMGLDTASFMLFKYQWSIEFLKTRAVEQKKYQEIKDKLKLENIANNDIGIISKSKILEVKGVTDKILNELIKRDFLEVIDEAVDKYRVLKSDFEYGLNSLEQEQINEIKAILQKTLEIKLQVIEVKSFFKEAVIRKLINTYNKSKVKDKANLIYEEEAVFKLYVDTFFADNTKVKDHKMSKIVSEIFNKIEFEKSFIVTFDIENNNDLYKKLYDSYLKSGAVFCSGKKEKIYEGLCSICCDTNKKENKLLGLPKEFNGLNEGSKPFFLKNGRIKKETILVCMDCSIGLIKFKNNFLDTYKISIFPLFIGQEQTQEIKILKKMKN